VAGTNRVAETGAWLGGVVPYGYRKEGERGQGRLVISEEPIHGFELSEAEVGPHDLPHVRHWRSSRAKRSPTT